MVAATPVDTVVNPNNSAQRYVLWGNGRIDAYGGATPLEGPDFYHRIDQQVCVAMHITSWTPTVAGYVLDCAGAFHPLGSAPTIARDPGGDFGFTLGLPYLDIEHRYYDWSWNPSGSVSGYVVDWYGEIFEFGGEPDAGRPAIFNNPAVRGFKMRWTPTKAALILDAAGAVWAHWDAVAPNPAPPYWNRDATRDLVVTQFAPSQGYVLTNDGATHGFGGAASPLYGGPYRKDQDVARELHVLNASNPVRLWQVHSGGESFEYVASTPPTVAAAGGVSEQQRITITGSPTAGTFTLTYSGQTTAAIARTATAAAVQTALEALSNIGVGDVVVTGAFPVWTVTFAGALANTDLPQMTATSSLTGGTSPAITVTTLTTGTTTSPAATVTDTTRPVLSWTYSDPQQDAQAAWELYAFTQTFVTANNMADPSVHAASALIADSGINPGTRGVTPSIDLANGSYRYYVRAKDTADQWSAWSNRGWVQNVPVPATPTGLTATANQSTFSVALSVSATTGGTANRIRFEYSDDGLVTWTAVRGADAVPIATTVTATDWDPPLGKARTYRAVSYNTAPRVKSASSNAATATVTTTAYLLRSTTNTALGGRVYPQEPVEWTRTVKAGVFEGIGAKYPTVVSDGVVKARRMTLHLVSLDDAGWAIISGLIESDSTLSLRDPYGSVTYCRIVGDVSRTWLKSGGSSQMYTVDLPLVEVAPPTTVS